MAIGIKKFNWVNRPTRWQHAQAWNSMRKQMVQRFLDEGSVAANAFANAQNSMTSGMSTLAAQASIVRAQNDIKAAQAKMTNSLNLLA